MWLYFTAQQARTNNGSASWVFMQMDMYNSSAPNPPSATSGKFSWDTALDPVFGDLYEADLGNNRVLIYQGGMLPKRNGMAANVVLGQPDFVTNNPGPANDQMNWPSAVVLHPKNRTVWVSDWHNNRVLRFSNVLAYSQDAASLDLIVGFQGESPTARMLPKGAFALFLISKKFHPFSLFFFPPYLKKKKKKDSNGTTHPGVFQFLLQPQGIDEMNAENETVTSFVFPVSGYNTSSSVNAQRTQQFGFLLSVPQVQVSCTYFLFVLTITEN